MAEPTGLPTGSGAAGSPRWFVRGDLDGFFGLALDNLIQLLLIVGLCGSVLGFHAELIYGQVLPGAALSLLAGNLFYSWQAMQLARREGRTDVCALPYGINTVSLFIYVFLVMLPVKLTTQDPELAWRAGLVACFGSGCIELGGAFAVDWLRRRVPRAAMLSTLAGIACTFISIDFLFRTYADPIVGLSTFAIVCLVYFGGLRFRGGIPGGLVAVAVGALLWWVFHGAAVPATAWAGATAQVGARVPVLALGDLFAALGEAGKYVAIIIPMGLFNLLGSLQNLDSAEAAGDRYPTRPSLVANGAGTLVAAAFGSCFPTTIYIGHPGWKQLGARIGYSWLNGVFLTLVCVSGMFGVIAWLIPVEAGMAIVLWIAIVITAQAFQATPRTHAPAVVIGLLPGIAAWGAIMLKTGMRAGGARFDGRLQGTLEALGVHPDGVFALAEGGIFTAMILAAAAVGIIERRFQQAAAWLWVAAVLSLTGLMHGWYWTGGDTAMSLDLWRNLADMRGNAQAAVGYGLAGALCFLAPWLGTVAAFDQAGGPADESHDQRPPPGG